MKRIKIRNLFFAFALALVACGEDSTVEKAVDISRSGVDVVSDISMLPDCGKSNDRELVWVKNETTPRMCSDGKWYAVVEDSVAKMCYSKTLADGSGTKIVCGGDSIGVILNGRDGKEGLPGESGEKGIPGSDGNSGQNGKNGADGKDGTDGKDGVDGLPGTTGKDGADGHDGAPGTDGKNGENGTDGKNGANCSLESIDEFSARVICGEDSTILYVGDDSSGVGEIVLDSEKVAVSLDEVSGVTQKGPFLSGSRVLVREMEDGRTLTQTGNSFNGKILNDRGEFVVNARMLVSQYVMLEATGYYRNEVTGEKSSSELTLFAITDVNDRNVVNVNLLTHLEYERVVYLVTKKKMKVKAAKRQAQKEVFALLEIDATGFSNSEDLNIVGGSDEDGALLAFSLMLQGDREVSEFSELLIKIATDMEEDGTWDDVNTKKLIASWALDADLSGRLATIRNNVLSWGLSSVVPNFEQYVRHFWMAAYGIGECTESNADSMFSMDHGGDPSSWYICRDSVWRLATDLEKDTYGWKDTTDGALKAGSQTNSVYVFDKTGSFDGNKGWRMAEPIEQLYGGCREALYDSIRTNKADAQYYVCDKTTHKWLRVDDYVLVDTQHWPSSTDGAVKWGDSVGVVDDLERICYVWDASAKYNGWRAGNANDCNMGLLGCTAKRAGETTVMSDGAYYSCAKNKWVEITKDVYDNTYLYRCTTDGEGENVFKEGDLVYGIVKTTTHFACEGEMWRSTEASEEQVGEACTAQRQGHIVGAMICDAGNWRELNVYDYPEGTDWTNPEYKYGTLYDSRDGRTYKTVVYKGITVMAENLNYADSVRNPYLRSETMCYNGDSLNCRKAGRYYYWTAAMNVDSKFILEGLVDEPDSLGFYQGICPDGWHIPTQEEHRYLMDGNLDVVRSAMSILPVGYGSFVSDDFVVVLEEGNFRYVPSDKFQSPYTGETYFFKPVRCIKSMRMGCKVNAGSVCKDWSEYTLEEWNEMKAKYYTKEMHPDANYGDDLVDARDNNVYKTVFINGKRVMAENLRYVDSVHNEHLKNSNFYCDGDKLENCAIVGGYYTWTAAMEICPEGWHIPSEEEWEDLISGIEFNSLQMMGLNSEWSWATDVSGFSAIPNMSEHSYYYGIRTHFWSSTTSTAYSDTLHASYLVIWDNSVGIGIQADHKSSFKSVRCIQNQ